MAGIWNGLIELKELKVKPEALTEQSNYCNVSTRLNS